MQPTSHDVLTRPAREADLPIMARIATEAYHRVDLATYQRSWPDPKPRSAAGEQAWIARARHTLGTDPDGCWVAEVDATITGFAVSRVRESMWILSSFAVRPENQGRGLGNQLITAALHHGRGCLRGMLASSADPRAVRTYRRAGFTLHPQMLLRGRVHRPAIPGIDRVREGTATDTDLMDSVDRQTRGAAHGPDHEPLLAQFRLTVHDHTTGSGYAYVDSRGAPVLLAATNRRTAAALLWDALASAPAHDTIEVRHITAANAWALDVGLEAGLEVHQNGYLCLRNMTPPKPYLQHGSLL